MDPMRQGTVSIGGRTLRYGQRAMQIGTASSISANGEGGESPSCLIAHPVKYAWIDGQRDDYGLDEMCSVPRAF